MADNPSKVGDALQQALGPVFYSLSHDDWHSLSSLMAQYWVARQRYETLARTPGIESATLDVARGDMVTLETRVVQELTRILEEFGASAPVIAGQVFRTILLLLV
jgi:hypothetical protein